MLNGADLGGAVKGTFDSVANTLASVTGSGSGSKKELDLTAAFSELHKLVADKVFNGPKDPKANGNNSGYQNSGRGFIRSEWFTEDLLNANPEIAAILDGLDATSWVFYQNDNAGKGGLYWTPENLQALQDNGTLNKRTDYVENGNPKATDASNEYVLYLNYNPNAKESERFCVMQNRIWLDQKDMAPIGTQTLTSGATSTPALAKWGQEGGEKENAMTVSVHGSLEEAQQAYSKYKDSIGVVQVNRLTNNDVQNLKKL